MRKVFSFFAVSLLLASSVDARQKPLEVRVGDATTGPVESVRTEVADITVGADGLPSEGPRRLSQTKTYSPDGRRSEMTVYDREGAVRVRTLQVYDDGGNLVETSSFDGRGVPLRKRVYARRGDQTATYDGEGRLQELVVLVWNEKRDKLAEVRKYDGDGALMETKVNRHDADNKKSTWATYGPGGNLKEKTTHDLNYGGPQRHEKTIYNPDGSVAGGWTGTSDSTVSQHQSVTTGPNGEPLRRERVRSERDSRRNVVKYVNYKWNHERGEYEPYRVAYHVIKYRE